MGISLHGANTDRVKKIIEVVSQLHGPTLISKGPVDVISDAKSTMVCGTSAGWWIRQGAKRTISGQKVAGRMNGSWLPPIKLLWCPAAGARRCGSQGDILSGVMSVFVSWTRSFMAEAAKSGELVLPELNHMVLAAFGACNVTRQVHQTSLCDSLGLMLSSSKLLAWCDLCAICPQFLTHAFNSAGRHVCALLLSSAAPCWHRTFWSSWALPWKCWRAAAGATGPLGRQRQSGRKSSARVGTGGRRIVTVCRYLFDFEPCNPHARQLCLVFHHATH